MNRLSCNGSGIITIQAKGPWGNLHLNISPGGEVKLLEHELTGTPFNDGSKVARKRLWTKTQMIQAYAEAKLSGRLSNSPEDQQIYNTRRESCFGKTPDQPCPQLTRNGKGENFCGSCGCGYRKEAQLDGDPPKLTFVKLRCPLGKPGFSNHQDICDQPSSSA